jgi:hypothetical protein
MTNFGFRRAARVKEVAAEVLAFVWGVLALSFSMLIMALFFRV